MHRCICISDTKCFNKKVSVSTVINLRELKSTMHNSVYLSIYNDIRHYTRDEKSRDRKSTMNLSDVLDLNEPSNYRKHSYHLECW